MPNEEKKPSIVHHVVYSTKGGCGKTTFSLFLLLSGFCRGISCELKKDNLIEIKNGTVCVNGESKLENLTGSKHVRYMMDVDFLGSSIMSIISNEDEEEKASGGGNGNDSSAGKYIRMNDLIFNEDDIRYLDESPNKIRDNIYIVPSSVKEENKERFHVKRKFTPLLRYDEFAHEIEAIVEEIKLREEIKKGSRNNGDDGYVIDFIYDMPPNSDGYTEAIFDYLRREAKKEDEKVILYLVYNNYSMLTSNAGWLSRFISGGQKTDFSYCVVYNDTGVGDKSQKSAGEVKTHFEGERKWGTALGKDIFYVYNALDDEVINFNNSVAQADGDVTGPDLLRNLFKAYRDTSDWDESKKA